MNAPHPSRRELLQRAGLLIVGFSLGGGGCSVDAPDAPENLVRATNPESLDSWLAIARDGSVTVYTGRVDLGTGTEIALAQFAAEELDVPIERVHVVMGDTRLTPDQGKTTASLNMIRGSQPIRVAAAEARAALVAMAAQRLGVEQADLETIDGTVRVRSTPTRSVSYGELIGDRTFDITMELTGRTVEDVSRGVMLMPRAPLKEFADYRVVGTSVPRPDIPAKVAGTFPYIHNIRIPGMVHGRVVRPPAFGAKLLSVSAESIASVPDAEIIRRNDFLGVVAAREEDAVRAASLLRAEWSDVTPLPEMDALYEELPRRAVLSDATTYNVGDVAAGLARGAHRLSASYQFPFQDHAMIGPSCAIADVNASRALIWSGSQWPQGDRSDIAKMLGLPLESVHLIWYEASGSYGRLGCDDAAADAAVMSQLIGRPVRVQWMRHDEHAWEPLSPAMLMNIEGASDGEGRLTAFDYTQYSPSHSTGEKGNHLAWHLIGGAPGHGRMSGAAANLWYDIPAKRARNIYVEPWLRGIYLRSPGGFQSIFAYESFMDEMAALTGTDPLEFRLKNTTDARDQAVLEAAARMSGWQRRDRVRPAQTGAVMTGRGLSLARYGTGESRSALVADVEVERATGRVRVTRCFIAFDCGLVINPDGAINQVEGGLLQGVSRALHEEVRFDRRKVTSLNWVDYPILKFTEVPEVQVELVSRPDTPWSSAGEAGTVASASAVANAVYDATGKRVRRLPLTPAYVQSLL